MTSDDVSAANDQRRLFPPLIGRAGEVVEISSLLGTARLFTLTGPGGSGKTRLAAQIAAESGGRFPDGVRWVDLAVVFDPTVVAHVVAARCGVVERGASNVLDALIESLRSRRLLVILDNCEHLLSACVNLIVPLLASCPNLHILATSREALAIPGEVVWLVSPLRVPEQEVMLEVENLLAYEAVELFVARAAEVRPQFHLTAENVDTVVRICRRLEGLPLALELAAARFRVLSLSELDARLENALQVLTRGSRNAPQRHQTLRATLDWSFLLLIEQERVVLRRLSVFPGSFSLAAAERVCAGPDLDESDVLDLLSQLVEKSLVSIQDRSEETRFRLLEPVLQYARERLVAADEAERIERQHRDWCAEFGQSAASALTGPQQGHWLDRLETEYDNFRSAFGWSLEHGENEIAGQIAAGIWQLWLLRGSRHEGRHWLDQILIASLAATPLRAHLSWVAGILARPDAIQAKRRFEESLHLWQSLEDCAGAARTLGSLGFMSQARGEHELAVDYLKQSLALARESADVSGIARVLSGLSLSVLEIGDMERALALCQEALALFQRTSDPGGIAAATANLGAIWRVRGDEQRAADLFHESLTIRRRIGDRGGVADSLALLGDQALDQGQHGRAVALYQESLALRNQLGEDDSVPALLDGLAAGVATQGDPVVATRLAACSEALRRAADLRASKRMVTIHEQTLATLRARIHEGAFLEAWNQGQHLSMDQALEAARTLRRSDEGFEPSVPLSGKRVEKTTSTPSGDYSLTRREVEVLRLLTFGLTYAQMAESLSISARTIDAHVRSIFGKLDVHSRSAATRIALQSRLV